MPGPLERFLDLAGGPVRGEQLTFSGTGAARQPVGPLSVWLALAYQARLVPSQGFVLNARTRLRRLPLRSIVQEYSNGHGRYRAGRRVLNGDAIDRAQYAELWAWTFVLAPRSAFARPEVVAELVGANVVRVLFPFGTETWQARLCFDADSGLLAGFETHRQEASTRAASPWSLEVTAWGSLAGRAFPTEVLTRWRARPALRLRLEAAQIGAAAKR